MGIKFSKIKGFFKKLPRILAEYSFLTVLSLIFLALILGGIIFYKYNVLIEKTQPEIFEKPLHFDEKTYQAVLRVWQERQKRFEETEIKIYPDLFRSSTSTGLTE